MTTVATAPAPSPDRFSPRPGFVTPWASLAAAIHRPRIEWVNGRGGSLIGADQHGNVYRIRREPSKARPRHPFLVGVVLSGISIPARSINHAKHLAARS